ncbi:MAG TPA: hypothetical protein VEI02_16955 [Planctomycetota bacterium]|nr:hypothetical protein [Planctomycetota bacterium]
MQHLVDRRIDEDDFEPRATRPDQIVLKLPTKLGIGLSCIECTAEFRVPRPVKPPEEESLVGHRYERTLARRGVPAFSSFVVEVSSFHIGDERAGREKK